MLDIVLSLAKTKAAAIGKVVGKSPKEVRSAIEQGQRMMPELKEKGVGALKDLGISSEFLDDIYNKYGAYADRLPGFSKRDLDSLRSQLSKEPKPPAGRARQKKKASGGFNKDDYLSQLK